MSTFLFRTGHLLVVAGLTLSVTACGRDEGDPEREKMKTTTVDSLNSTMGDTPEKDMPTVDVTLGDGALAIPATHKAGPISLAVKNDGRESHALEVKGEGISQRIETDLKPGESRIMVLALKPGSYTVACPIAGHESAHGAATQLMITE